MDETTANRERLESQNNGTDRYTRRQRQLGTEYILHCQA